MIAMFILGCVMGLIYPTEVIKEYTSISGEYTDEVFNTTLALVYWLSGVAVYVFFQAINSICYRLDLLVDKK